MSPRTAAQNQAIREKTRQKFLEAALLLFARYGYEKTSMRMIAKETGMAVGLVYKYFEGKHALLKAIFEQSLADIEASFQPMHAETDPSKRLEGLIRSSLNLIREHVAFWRLFYSLRMQPAVLEELAEEAVGLANQLTQAFVVHFKSIDIPNPEAEAKIFFAIIDGVGIHFAFDPENYPLDEVIDSIVHKYCHHS